MTMPHFGFLGVSCKDFIVWNWTNWWCFLQLYCSFSYLRQWRWRGVCDRSCL